MLSQVNNTTESPNEVPLANMKSSKLESKVALGVYWLCVDALITNTLFFLSVKLATDPACVDYSRYLYSFLMLHLPLNIVVGFNYNTSYEEKGIEIWSQVCENHDTLTPKSLLPNFYPY